MFLPFLFDKASTVGQERHDPCFHVFLMDGRVITFVTYCTFQRLSELSRLKIPNELELSWLFKYCINIFYVCSWKITWFLFEIKQLLKMLSRKKPFFFN